MRNSPQAQGGTLRALAGLIAKLSTGCKGESPALRPGNAGRQEVVAAVCDPRRLLVAFDGLARAHPRSDGKGFPGWSPDLLRTLGFERIRFVRPR